MSRTYGEMMEEALAIKTQEEADVWFKNEVKVMKEANPNWTLSECAKVVRDNLGYMAGYYNKSVSEHIAKFFKAGHPIFGSPSYWDKITSKEAFEKGKEFATKKEVGKNDDRKRNQKRN